MTGSMRLIRHQIYIKPSNIHGYGVFADTTIQPNEIIEECYALQLDEDVPVIHDFFYSVEDKPWFALGYGSIYNHSTAPNAYLKYDIKRSLLTVYAAALIKKDEEIFVCYGKNWFKSRRKKPKELFWRTPFRVGRAFFWFVTRMTIMLLSITLLVKLLSH